MLNALIALGLLVAGITMFRRRLPQVVVPIDRRRPANSPRNRSNGSGVA